MTKFHFFLRHVQLLSSSLSDITTSNINLEYMDAGLSFPHNRDIDGKPILVLKSKLHIRGARDNEQLFRIFIYWMERLNRYMHTELNFYCIPTIACTWFRCRLSVWDLNRSIALVILTKIKTRIKICVQGGKLRNRIAIFRFGRDWTEKFGLGLYKESCQYAQTVLSELFEFHIRIWIAMDFDRWVCAGGLPSGKHDKHLAFVVVYYYYLFGFVSCSCF